MENIYHEISENDLIETFIEYKELRQKDFKGIKTKENNLIIDEDTYLSDVAFDYIDLDEHNTVVVNSSVGQGKSTLVIDIAKKYYKLTGEYGEPLYTIIFAVPYKSLIEQYIRTLKKELKEEGFENIEIPDYTALIDEEAYKDILDNFDKLKAIDEDLDVISSGRIHVVTVNCLLANPGENAFEQNFVKRGYLEKIIKTNRDENRKVVLIFDEIHDAIHNFQQDLVFYLWRFRTNYVLHKTFILSATFNEASKVVIKYIAELTSKQLQIIQTKRIQRKKDLSNLHIHVTAKDYYDFSENEFVKLFEKITSKHKIINILSYSRNLCTRIAEDDESAGGIRDKILSKSGVGLNVCIPSKFHLSNKQKKNKKIPESVSYHEKYVEGKCNIGTTFQTGISINEEDTALVIILPLNKNIDSNRDAMGIFYRGTNTLIQSLARVRSKSDIYVIMPHPKLYIRNVFGTYIDEYDYISKLMNIEIFEPYYMQNEDLNYLHKYYSEQEELILRKYNNIRDRIEREIEWVKDNDDNKQRRDLPYLNYPTQEIFILEKGEKYLCSKYASFGRDLSAYVIWGAFTNQFVNCRLISVSSNKGKERVLVEDMQKFLCDFFMKSYGESVEDMCVCDFDLFENIYKRINTTKDIYVKGEKLDERMLKVYIMTFIQRSIKGNKRMQQGYTSITFKKEDYLLCSIANAMIYRPKTDIILKNTQENNLIKSYQDLHKIRKLFFDKLMIHIEGETNYIYNSFQSYNNPFNNKEIEFILNTFSNINKDVNLRNIDKNMISLTNKDKALNSIYRLLKGTFFNIERDNQKEPTEGRTGNQRLNIDYVSKKLLPLKRTGLNLLYRYKYIRDENFDNDILEELLIDEYNDNVAIQSIDNRPISENDIETNKWFQENYKLKESSSQQENSVANIITKTELDESSIENKTASLEISDNPLTEDEKRIDEELKRLLDKK